MTPSYGPKNVILCYESIKIRVATADDANKGIGKLEVHPRHVVLRHVARDAMIRAPGAGLPGSTPPQPTLHLIYFERNAALFQSPPQYSI
jgi:hypothetical protein